MAREIIFISDLHISFEKTEITQRFLKFLDTRARQAESVYILGDLFDAWIGDDDPTPPNSAIKKKLKELTASGTKVYLQLGNRDFLIGHRFFEATGVEPLSDYAVIDLFGIATLLTHGDLLCTDDIAYQQFREKSRSPEWQRNVLDKPLWIRLIAARWYRLRSHFHKRNKTQEIMDVNHQTVIDTMRRYAVTRLIHGHTHRPAIHDFSIDGQPAQRIVLPDWKKDSARILCWTEQNYRFETL
ncbi:MAG: UDP-2,3-diacylglucosamine diphosphatase [Methylomicrobium sp.]